MKLLPISKYLILFLILVLQVPVFSDDSQISLSSKKLNQGGVIFIKIAKAGADRPELKWMKKKIPLLYRPGKAV